MKSKVDMIFCVVLALAFLGLQLSNSLACDEKFLSLTNSIVSYLPDENPNFFCTYSDMLSIPDDGIPRDYPTNSPSVSQTIGTTGAGPTGNASVSPSPEIPS